MSANSSEPKPSSKKLSARQIQMLKLAAEGYTDKEMAAVLGISATTVTTYWKRLKSRFEGHSRTSLVVALIGNAFDAENLPPPRILNDLSESGDSEEPLINPQRLLEELNIGIMFETDDRKISYANPAFVKLFKFTSEEQKLSFTDCRRVLQNSKQMFLNAAKFNNRIENHIQLKVSVRGENVRLADGRLLEYDYTPILEGETQKAHLWTFRELGSQAPEASVQPTEPDRAMQMIERHPIPRILLTNDGTIEYLNPAAEKLLRISLDKVKSKNLFEVHAAFWTPWFKLLWETTSARQHQRHAEGELTGVSGWHQASITNLNDGTSLSIRDKTNEHLENKRLFDSSHLVETIGNLAADLIGASAGRAEEALKTALRGVSEYIRSERALLVTFGANPEHHSILVSHGVGNPPGLARFKTAHDLQKLDGWPDAYLTGPLTILDTETLTPLPEPDPRSVTSAIPRGILVVPLVEQDIIRGYIQFESDSGFRVSMLANRTPYTLLASCVVGGIKQLASE